MKVLVLHTKYRYAGGEDAVVDSEIALLRRYGVEVHDVQLSNEASGLPGAVQLGRESAWSEPSYRLVKKLCADWRPDVVHVHNFWMRLSPSVHTACREAGIPVVQTLHNFRLLCLRGDFLRDGKVCTDCLGEGPWRGVLHRCYRDSFLASAAVARMIARHRSLETWDRQVDSFIALSSHSRSKFIAGGLDPAKISVKPNFVDDLQGAGRGRASASHTIVYVGRLAPEKGLDTLLEAWKAASPARGELVIIGDGPLRADLEAQARSLGLDPERVRFLGPLRLSRVLEEMAAARAVVIPSLCFENCPRSVLEAYCSGRPVLTSRIGALDEFVHDWQTGLKFQPGDPADLGASLSTILSDPDLADRLGARAREEYLAHYTPARNFSMLAAVYDSVLMPQAPGLAAVATAHSR